MPIPGGDNSLVYDVKLSSVVPASITGENKVHELTNMDLVMKLHYIKGVYFFKADAVQGLSTNDLKRPLFQVLIPYYPTCGRIRMWESGGRPYIRCNDSGVRIIEAKCGKTVEEWLEMNDSSLNDQLTYNQFFGPDLGFDPLVFIQFTWFKCGGLSVGLSWAHILGDVFSASQFINTLGSQITVTGGLLPPAGNHLEIPPITGNKAIIPKVPYCLQKVQLDPAGGKWLVSNRCKMQSHSFHITAEHLNNLAKLSPKLGKKKPFEVISATIWKSIAKVRGKIESSEPKTITICSYEKTNPAELVSLGNSQVTIWTVETSKLKVGVSESDLTELADLIDGEKVDETSRIEEALEQEDNGDGKCEDFILYGANLTFVNLEGVKIYGLELKGQKPVRASYNISGIGDEGVVLVLPAGPNDGDEEMGRMVNLILPEDQLEDLKKELQSEWRIF
ncbi:OLC1v1017214C1 [Oldenlandia corymbosa var. corymbosa]|uniref:OLC1v1017214C1 n=1 Tax=Oldenlandia corymbosa var. corymbosa TaxID=529605 RepID=A0AAV1E903_OLDCO|nr:OLC1v1017214C1 [Oldenlandia corymbosa var. corymbosa]